MLKSEIVLLTVTVLGTLTAWLAGPSASPVNPTFGEPRIVCSAPSTVSRLSFGEAQYIARQNSDRISQTLFWRRG
jgi:hypothetical protein